MCRGVSGRGGPGRLGRVESRGGVGEIWGLPAPGLGLGGSERLLAVFEVLEKFWRFLGFWGAQTLQARRTPCPLRKLATRRVFEVVAEGFGGSGAQTATSLQRRDSFSTQTMQTAANPTSPELPPPADGFSTLHQPAEQQMLAPCCSLKTYACNVFCPQICEASLLCEFTKMTLLRLAYMEGRIVSLQLKT